MPVYPRDAPSSNTIELAELRKEISDLKNDDKKLEELKHNNDIDKVRKDEVITQIKDQIERIKNVMKRHSRYSKLYFKGKKIITRRSRFCE